MCAFIRTHHIVQLRRVHFTLCKFSPSPSLPPSLSQYQVHKALPPPGLCMGCCFYLEALPIHPHDFPPHLFQGFAQCHFISGAFPGYHMNIVTPAVFFLHKEPAQRKVKITGSGVRLSGFKSIFQLYVLGAPSVPLIYHL